jgi:hypothetical protein
MGLLLSCGGSGGQSGSPDVPAGDTQQDTAARETTNADERAEDLPESRIEVADGEDGDRQPLDTSDLVSPPLTLRAGVAKTLITPAFEPYEDLNGNHHYDEGEPFEDLNGNGEYDSLYVGGFGLRTPTGVHDDLWARTVAIEVGADLLIFVSLDILGLSMKRVEAIKARVGAQFPGNLVFNPDTLVIASTHTHQGPDTMGVFGPNSGPGWDEAYLSLVVDKATESVLLAVQDLRPASLWLASTSDTEDLVRDLDPPVILDPYVGLIQARTPEGEVIATLLSIANHPEACWGDNTLISSDYVHYLRESLEAEVGGMALFFAGALGLMQSPTTMGEAGFERAEIVGNTYAQRILKALEDAQEVERSGLLSRHARLRIPVVLQNPELYIGVAAEIAEGYSEYLYRTEAPPCDFFGCLDLPVFLWRLGDLLTVMTFPGELTPELIVGGIVLPPDYQGPYPDAPSEPVALDHVQTPFRFVVGLADSATGYYFPKKTFDLDATWSQRHGAGPDAAMTLMTAVAAGLSDLNEGFSP